MYSKIPKQLITRDKLLPRFAIKNPLFKLEEKLYMKSRCACGPYRFVRFTISNDVPALTSSMRERGKLIKFKQKDPEF